MSRISTVMLAVLILLTPQHIALAAPPKPVPKSPYIAIVYKYADTMLQQGRDNVGEQKTGLLLSILDRTTFKSPDDSPIANPQSDQNLLRILYTLSELSTKPVYRQAADAELAWFLKNPARPDSPLAAWDQNASWNVLADKSILPNADAPLPPARAWMLWDRCFGVDPESAKRAIAALQNTRGQIPKRIGFSIRAFAVAYKHTIDPAFLKAIENALAIWRERSDISPDDRLSIAIDTHGAAGLVPEPLAGRLREFAAEQDKSFCALPHDLKASHGFAVHRQATSLWPARPGAASTASIAMMCVSRYDNTANVAYRDLIRAAADAYKNAAPPDGALPVTFGHAISLQVAAWRHTSNIEYFDQATRLADLAIKTFWADGPLPRSTSTSNLYDTATGADTLALALLELHLEVLHITAARCPPNTIDR